MLSIFSCVHLGSVSLLCSLLSLFLKMEALHFLIQAAHEQWGGETPQSVGVHFPSRHFYDALSILEVL